LSRATTVWVVFGALVVALVLAPAAAFAQRGGGGGGGRGGGMHGGGGRIISAPTTITGPGPVQVGPTPFPQSHRGSFGARGHGFHGHHHVGHHHQNRFGHHHHRGFVGKGFIGAGPVWWGAPYYYPYYGQAYYDTAQTYVYAPPVVYSAPTYSPAPMPRVVEYPTGRYELRGDGYGTPYHWIWIPNAPAAPPPPAEPAPTTPPASITPEPPGKTTVYRWTDANGITHYTDRADSVPAQYRTPARSGPAS
jgi:hypothetical protein